MSKLRNKISKTFQESKRVLAGGSRNQILMKFMKIQGSVWDTMICKKINLRFYRVIQMLRISKGYVFGKRIQNRKMWDSLGGLSRIFYTIFIYVKFCGKKLPINANFVWSFIKHIPLKTQDKKIVKKSKKIKNFKNLCFLKNFIINLKTWGHY